MFNLFSCKLPPKIDRVFFFKTKASTKTTRIMATDASDATIATGNGLDLGGMHESERQSLGFPWGLQEGNVLFQDISYTNNWEIIKICIIRFSL